MRRILLIIFFLSLLKLSADEIERAIGLSAGYISGSGFAYRVMSQDSGYQIGAGHFSAYEAGKQEISATNLAYTFYHNFANTPNVKFYLLLGANYFHLYEDNKPETDNYINLGAGIGAELSLSKRITWAIEWPWYYEGESNFIKFIPQTGIYYYW